MDRSPNVHLDCRSYAPLDVAQGICHRTKQACLGDEPCCEHFEPMPRCKRCSHFTPASTPYLGHCRAEPDAPMTYPDLAAVTCVWFEPLHP